MEVEPEACAKAAGLRYVGDDEPGIRRHRRGRGFTYTGPEGDRIRDPEVLARVRALAIPPAWQEVWICNTADGHLQATGRDDRGRKQYRYHARWMALRQRVNFDRMLDFGQCLPLLRRRVQRHLARPGLPREKVLAAILTLLDRTLIRVGNREYARSNDSYGVTTLRPDHVHVRGEALRLRFRGKSGKEHTVRFGHPRVARVVRACRQIPGQYLFCWLDADGEPHEITSTDVNDYLAEVSGGVFTAKDFRTWGGTVRAFGLLREIGPAASATAGKRNIVAAIKEVAAQLGNTPAVCRKHYVHPDVLEAYLDGTLFDVELPPRRARSVALGRSEQGVLTLLAQRRAADPAREACVEVQDAAA